MFFLDALSSKEEEPILVLDDSTKIFEIDDYSLILEDSYIFYGLFIYYHYFLKTFNYIYMTFFMFFCC